VVETPVNLSARQRELLEELESISSEQEGRNNPRAKSWMDKVREFFGT
jgi:molecular chaperone DnaJ